MRVRAPDGLLEPVPLRPDGIHPATVLVCAESVGADGFWRDFEIHVELAGRDPGERGTRRSTPRHPAEDQT